MEEKWIPIADVFRGDNPACPFCKKSGIELTLNIASHDCIPEWINERGNITYDGGSIGWPNYELDKEAIKEIVCTYCNHEFKLRYIDTGDCEVLVV